MIEQDFLYELVQSLDEVEVNFIIRFAESRRRRPDRMLNLLQDLRKDKLTPRSLQVKYRSYGVLKFKLKQMILHALRLMNTSQNAERRINVHLENEDILYRKGLFDQAGKELRQARKIAEDHDKLDRLLQILQLEQHRNLEQHTKNLTETTAENVQETKAVLARLIRHLEAAIHYKNLFAAYRTQDESPFESVQTPDLIKDLPQDAPLSFHGQIYEWMSQSLIARSKGDFATAQKAVQAALNAYEEPDNAHLKEDQFDNYKALLSINATYMVPLQDLEGLREIIEKLKGIRNESFSAAAETFQNKVQLQLLYINNTREFQGFAALVRSIRNGIEKFDAKINPARKLSLWYNIMLGYFIQEKFEPAQEYLDLILEHKRFKVRKEIQYAVRLLKLVIYLETESWDDFMDSIVALERYLQRQKQLTPFKKAMVKSFYALQKSYVSDQKRIFAELHATLLKVQEEDQSPEFLSLNLLTVWTQSKVEQKSLRECLDS